MSFYSYSPSLERKINRLLQRKRPIALNTLSFSSPFLLAPMAAIGNAPFRLLMQELGSGGSISEFISCQGILHGNRRTRQMLRINPLEKNVGIQLFGQDSDKMAQAALLAQEQAPSFIDINLGCPVRRVISKGAGAALLKDPVSLGKYLETIKKVLNLPLTIKIRMGWDSQCINGDEVCHVAQESGVTLVSIHGRTRSQGYGGKSNWDYIEWLSSQTPLPLIGNGDLHQPQQVRECWKKTHCSALMIARGCLRNPFIFLESYLEEGEELEFSAKDHFEVLQRYQLYVSESFPQESVQMVQIRKLILWFASGFPNAREFRSELFSWKTLKDLMNYTEDYFTHLGEKRKSIDYAQDFMMSGHG